MYLQKNKKGFTLIELMVVVAIIAILALLGLRMYSTQQEKAKISMAKANAGTVQVAIQTHLVDGTLSDASDAVDLSDLDKLQNPWDPTADAVGTAAAVGIVVVEKETDVQKFNITAYDGGSDLIPNYVLTAQK
jgi:prepilin-type N-terminal cleavage/methylation domain-containing protein